MCTASVDLNEFEGETGPVWLRLRLQDSSFNGWRCKLSDGVATDTWANCSMMVTPSWSEAEDEVAGWEIDLLDGCGSVSWAQTMGDVYTTEVRFDGARTLLVGIDNITLARVPEPGTWAVMLTGLAGLGWRSRRRQGAV